MPPVTIGNRADDLIEDIIGRLEEFGDQFNEIVEELRELQNEF
jgi:hypothetical protein